MAQDLFVCTRKGLFRFERTGDKWQQTYVAFLGEPVTAFLADPRTGHWFAALNLGHFGAKLHRSTNRGATWDELTMPALPKSEDKEAPSLKQIWALEASGPGQPGLIWAGSLPAALFRNEKDGEGEWQLVECGICPSGHFGLAAAPTVRRFTPFASIRVIPVASPSPAAACGAARMAAGAGPAAPRDCSPNTCRRSGAKTPRSKIRTASRSAAGDRIISGANIIMACSTAPTISPNGSMPARASALVSPCTQRIQPRRGSCRR